MSTPPTRIVPLSALSIPARRFRRVVFPEPDGHQRQEFPFGDVKGDIVQDRDGEVFPVIGLEDIPDFYNGSFRFGQINSLRAQDNFSVL